ncbi:Bifunctional protein GlmU [Marine Group I thaumarchaeote SCGC AAA799-E16]|uniref:3-deoxy-manno-octulosonate cytidylyltransferase protein n=2 Tax=Marine Group I TaxID=905826 RepID=A0A087S246_9ARCH|nr:Bifunctional protein GlmU [Marine Group I thaumarchaeote SCGC AAA799-E16]KFM19800.1 3-deoxy-manno-octulosonate cytidylyltransferase protein [Marine Group I thaumarchaeote SCGC RSA3]
MQIVIPMAGRGKRFAEQGFSKPKPLIDVNGKPMIKVVVDNLNIDAKYHFICQKDHNEKYQLKDFLHSIKPDCNVILVDEVTDGPASTVLLSKKFIDNDDELIISNSDQFVDWNSNDFLSFLRDQNADGGILSFEAYDDKWSFVRINDSGFVTEVAEKKPISNIATVGIYYFRHGKDFISAAEQMIQKNLRVNNEFYVAPVYNELIQEDKKILTYNIQKMYGLGTPHDLNKFLEHFKK